ncbi:MAG: IgGFc-binding protein, partial [Polyangiales bacterium]
GDVAILFLAGLPDAGPPSGASDNKPVRCPVTPARSSLTQLHGTGITHAFHIRTDVPVVAYQMLPYGGGAAAVTGATLLLPTSAWDGNYLAATAFSESSLNSMDIVAWKDDTTVTLLPNALIKAGGGIPAVAAGEPLTVHLDQGEVLQITQDWELTGSPIEADKPIGLFAGHPCLSVPAGVNYCDHAEQQIPPIRALGSEYLAVMHRPRNAGAENPPWRIVGAVDGTVLTYDPPVPGAPRSVDQGQVLLFTNKDRPFAVQSQDADHPFLFNGYMTGSSSVATGVGGRDGYGDADFVRTVPVPQYLAHYVFFTDPSYPETNLVVTRKKGPEGFADVTLDCLGLVSGWKPVGSSGLYETTYVDLVRHDFKPQNGCDNGRHEMTSPQPFGLTVWGWGTTETKSFTRDVSYGYPAGENLAALNTVVVPARPR